MKISGKKIIAIAFVLIIMLTGMLTVICNPVKIGGGLVRGFINSSEDASVFEKIGNSFSTFDTRMNEFFIAHDVSVNAYGGIQKILGRTLINDVDKSSMVLKLNNGYLTFKKDHNSDLSGLADYLVKLKEHSDDAGSELFYINYINKNTTDENLLPEFYPYIYDSNFNEIKGTLTSNDIQFFDINSYVAENNIDKYPLFFKTDHHWTPNTGLWVSELICEQINGMYGWELPVQLLDSDNFNFETYSNSFLGSQGKRIGRYYAGVDDIDVITPQYQTSMTVEYQDISETKTGSFIETMLYYECITPDNLLNKDATAYDVYMRGNHDLVKITNHNINEKKALVVMDSFGIVVVPFLSLVFNQVDCIDIRAYSDSVIDYISETQPDIVIYMISGYQQ